MATIGFCPRVRIRGTGTATTSATDDEFSLAWLTVLRINSPQHIRLKRLICFHFNE
jgi:hypothetical protein